MSRCAFKDGTSSSSFLEFFPFYSSRPQRPQSLVFQELPTWCSFFYPDTFPNLFYPKPCFPSSRPSPFFDCKVLPAVCFRTRVFFATNVASSKLGRADLFLCAWFPVAYFSEIMRRFQLFSLTAGTGRHPPLRTLPSFQQKVSSYLTSCPRQQFPLPPMEIKGLSFLPSPLSKSSGTAREFLQSLNGPSLLRIVRFYPRDLTSDEEPPFPPGLPRLLVARFAS